MGGVKACRVDVGPGRETGRPHTHNIRHLSHAEWPCCECPQSSEGMTRSVADTTVMQWQSQQCDVAGSASSTKAMQLNPGLSTVLHDNAYGVVKPRTGHSRQMSVH